MHVVATFLIGIPFSQQAVIFAVINGRQKPVYRSIICNLFGYSPLKQYKHESLYEGHDDSSLILQSHCPNSE